METRAVSERKRRRNVVVHIVRHRQTACRVTERFLLVPAPVQHADDPVADRKPSDIGPELDNISGDFGPGRKRQWRVLLVLVLDNQQIGKIDPACSDSNLDLTWPRCGRGNLFEHKRFWGSVSFAQQRLHRPTRPQQRRNRVPQMEIVSPSTGTPAACALASAAARSTARRSSPLSPSPRPSVAGTKRNRAFSNASSG